MHFVHSSVRNAVHKVCGRHYLKSCFYAMVECESFYLLGFEKKCSFSLRKGIKYRAFDREKYFCAKHYFQTTNIFVIKNLNLACQGLFIGFGS